MNHPHADKLVAIAEGRQMEVQARGYWFPIPASEALEYVADAGWDFSRLRIAPEQPAPAHTVQQNYDHFLSYTGFPDSHELRTAYEHGSDSPAPTKTVTVPLTDEQIQKLVYEKPGCYAHDDPHYFARAVIAEFCRINGITDAATAGKEI
jgi:hypothetical protein